MAFNYYGIVTRKEIRLKNYNYRDHGYYFVTICSHNRDCLFGEIIKKEMHLNAAGNMVQSVWSSLSQVYEGWIIDSLIVMPNHVHAVVCNVLSGNKIGLPNLIRKIKSFTATNYKNGIELQNWAPFHEKLWQRNYYEIIIKNRDSLHRIRKYILENPSNWNDPR